MRSVSERKLYARTYPGEYAKIIKENFGIFYEPGLSDSYTSKINACKLRIELTRHNSWWAH